MYDRAQVIQKDLELNRLRVCGSTHRREFEEDKKTVYNDLVNFYAYRLSQTLTLYPIIFVAINNRFKLFRNTEELPSEFINKVIIKLGFR